MADWATVVISIATSGITTAALTARWESQRELRDLRLTAVSEFLTASTQLESALDVACRSFEPDPHNPKAKRRLPEAEVVVRVDERYADLEDRYARLRVLAGPSSPVATEAEKLYRPLRDSAVGFPTIVAAGTRGDWDEARDLVGIDRRNIGATYIAKSNVAEQAAMFWHTWYERFRQARRYRKQDHGLSPLEELFLHPPQPQAADQERDQDEPVGDDDRNGQ
jgi:hypothetical protein